MLGFLNSALSNIPCTELVWYSQTLAFCAFAKCDRILENSSKSHKKSSVFLHVFNDISTYVYVFTEYFLHSFSNLSIKFLEIILGMQYFSCCSDKYTEIKMCDLEPFSKIQSQIVLIGPCSRLKDLQCTYTCASCNYSSNQIAVFT